MLRAKELYFSYYGSSFYMQRGGDYEEYQAFNISEKQEQIWKDELVENLFNRLSFESTYELHKLAMIAESYLDNNIADKLIVYIANNITKGDSFIKLNYAEVLLKLPCAKELIERKLNVVSDLLMSVSNNPITINTGRIPEGLSNQEYITNRLEDALNRLALGNEMMKFNEKIELHKKYLEDVALEISQDSLWRKKLFEGQYEEKLLITYKEIAEIPGYLTNIFEQYKLEYYVSKTRFCPETFDENLMIFKFEAKGLPDLVRYSGNNETVI